MTSPIACENSKPGNPSSEWDVSGNGDSTIQGFAADISVDKGQTVQLKVKSSTNNYRVDIYRMGFYAGMGARKVATVTPSAPQSQPACLTDSATGLYDCGNWSVNASWAVPADAVSGVYTARLVRNDTLGASHVQFVVRDDASTSALLFQTSDTTWQAYNTYGGNSLYTGSPAGRAYKVSYNRPLDNRGVTPADSFFNAEYPMVRWLEANGYDVTYTSGIDSDRRGNLILQHRTFLSVGHDEYWSGYQRTNVEAARAAGVNLAFFSGNEVFWKTRLEPSIASGATANRTLVSYKETHANAKIDPIGPSIWTGTWRDPRFSPPADGGRPENALTGTVFMVNGPSSESIAVPAADGAMRFWRNTSVATLPANQTATMPNGTLGYEWDEELDNGSRPPGLIDLSTATLAVSSKLQDYGSNYASGTATHHLSLYRHASGALVFGAGTVQWSWGLDANHDLGSTAADARMKQATVNLMADMGAQPATIQAGLVAATASGDAIRPTSTVTSPASGATVPVGNPVTVFGTATDAGGGVVGGVEVSVDGGATWHPAKGRASWSYTFTPANNGTITIKSRAADDNANLEVPGAGISLTVGSGGATGACPCNIWPPSAVPVVASDPDNAATEVGVKFRSDVAGFVIGVRFYKATTNTGTHVGSLWSSTGTRLATATFAGESASGWQQVNFASPVAVSANTTYVASYFAPIGRYAEDDNFFASSGVASPPLRALASGVDGANGVYAYGAKFPNQTYQSANYWVDVSFTTSTADTTPPTVTATSPTAGATGVAVAANLTGTFSESVQSASVLFVLRDAANAVVPAAVTYDDPSRTATLNPTADLAPGSTYTATLSGAKDLAGNTMVAPTTWSFTTVAADTTPPTVTSTAPTAGATAVAVASNLTGTFSESVQSASVLFVLRDAANAVVPAAVTYDDPSRTATLNPTADLAPASTYTATLSGAKDLAGNTMPTPTVWSFTTAAAAVSGCPCTIWPPTATPIKPAEADTAAVEVGVKFRSDIAGFVTGVRFYKGSGNTGTHVGSLWSSTGTRLGTATFSGESATGWQQVSFASPVAVNAAVTYVASYFAPVGRYAADGGAFAAAGVASPPLRALAEGVDGGNGVYAYGATSAFPSQSYQSTNYWVDVVFTDTLGPDVTPPVISGVASTPAAQGAAVTWSTNEASDSRVDFGLAPTALTSFANDTVPVTGHSVGLTGLSPSTVYYYRVTSKDAAGNTTTSPPVASAANSFTTTPNGVVDSTVSDFALGTPGATAYLADTSGGEVALAPAVGAEFSGAALPAGWASTVLQTGGTATVGAGKLTVNGATAQTTATYAPGRSLEFVATFAADANQHVGFGLTLNETPWAMFGTNTGGALFARSRLGTSQTNTNLGAGLLGGSHRFRIDWNAANLVFAVDGAVVATHSRAITTAMRPVVRDNLVAGAAVVVDWLRVTPYQSSGTFTSRVLDAGAVSAWGNAVWNADLPAGTTLSISVRTGNTATPDGTWSAFTALSGSGAPVGASSRYLQYRLDITTAAAGQTPALRDITFQYA